MKDGHATSSKEQFRPFQGARCAPVTVHSSRRAAARQSATHFTVVAASDDAAAAIAVPVVSAPAHVSKLLAGEGFGLSGASERRGRRTRPRRNPGPAQRRTRRKARKYGSLFAWRILLAHSVGATFAAARCSLSTPRRPAPFRYGNLRRKRRTQGFDLNRLDRERPDRDNAAIAILPGAIGQRTIDCRLLTRGFEC